jgi:site-specific DNA-methyltransferase (adenine-specific)
MLNDRIVTTNVQNEGVSSVFKNVQANLFSSSSITPTSNPSKSYEKFERIQEDTYIANGDCIDLFADIQTCSVDFILTDPPYNLGAFMHKRNTNLVKMRENHFAYSGWDDLPYDIWSNKMEDFFFQASRTVKKRGALLIFMSLMKVESIIRMAAKHKFYYKTTGIWHKTNPMPRNMNLHFVNSTEAWIYFIKDDTTGTFNNEGKVIHDFFETSLTTGKEKKHGKHPTQKPVKLLSQFVKPLTNEGELVLDPFMGSGSSGVASILHNRRFIGFELNERYYSISKNRLLGML